VKARLCNVRSAILKLNMAGWDWEEHVRLQPAVPNEGTGVPGRKWFKGVSIGSTQKPDERP
jgi:hypothetical protein